MANRRLSFVAEWYQEEAAIIRRFVISFYFNDNAVEISDQKTRKTFLRRTKIPELAERDFFVGSKINIFGRQFDIVDYADDLTRDTLAKYRKKTFILLKSSVINHLGLILCALIDSKFNINNGLMVQFTPDQVKVFLGDKTKGDVTVSALINSILSGPSIGLEVAADNAVEKMLCALNRNRDCITDMPERLWELCGRQDIRYGIYCSSTEEEVEKEINYFFHTKHGLQITSNLQNSTLAIIKPHVIKEGNLGKVVADITSNGFKITALRMHLLERVNCEEFLEIYRGILPEYISMVGQLASGVCLALEIESTDPNKNSHREFREFCGPLDPEIAKLLRPHTLRAKFGVSKSLNAVHCTDLAEDTIIELQYLFKILE